MKTLIPAPAHEVPQDPRDLPAYTYQEAGRALNIPPTTLGAWVRGQSYTTKEGKAYFERLIQRPEPLDTRLSFHNLIEAHILRALRTVHEFSMAAVREALEIAENEHHISRLFIHEDFRWAPGELFLKRYQSLVTLTRSEQFVMQDMVELYLERVDYDDERLARRFFPLTRGPFSPAPKTIVLDPRISFGRPIVASRGISTSAIRSRYDAGEGMDHIATDYGLAMEEVEQAVRYEVAA